MLTVAPTAWAATVAPANSKLDRTRSPILLALSGPPGTIGDKLFAAKPGDDVVGTRARSHHLSENTQDFIAQGVPETVVDRFEMIEIEYQQGHRLPASRLCCAHRVSAFSIKAGRLSRPVRWSVQAAVR